MPVKRPAAKGNKGKTAKGAAIARRRQKVAASVIAGTPISQVAREEGLSRSHLSREANSPETGLLIAELLAKHRDKISQLVVKSLTAIEEAFQAAKVIPVNGDEFGPMPMEAGPDHYARLKAAEKAFELVKLLQPKDPQNFTLNQTITWEMFLNLKAQADQRLSA